MAKFLVEMSDSLMTLLKNSGQIKLSEVDMGQYMSAQDRDDARRSRLSAPPYFTPDEEREIRAIRNNPEIWEDTEEGLRLSARLHEIKKKAELRKRER